MDSFANFRTCLLRVLKLGILLCKSVATTRKLGISFFEYVRDRISEAGKIPDLATIIREKSSGNPFGWSWQPE